MNTQNQMETKSRVRVKFPPTKVHHLVRKKQTNNEKKYTKSKKIKLHISSTLSIYTYTHLPHNQLNIMTLATQFAETTRYSVSNTELKRRVLHLYRKYIRNANEFADLYELDMPVSNIKLKLDKNLKDKDLVMIYPLIMYY